MSFTERIILSVMILLIYAIFCVCLMWRHRIRLRQQNTKLQLQNNLLLQQKERKSFLVAYASQSGTAEKLAKRCAQLLSSNVAYTLLPLNQISEDILVNSDNALFVVSTYGEGEAPDNAIKFSRQYLNTSNDIDLSHLEFTVLALGDRVYKQFCAFGHQVFEGLCKLGAVPMLQPLELCSSALTRQEISDKDIVSQWYNRLNLPNISSDLFSDNETSQSQLTQWKIVEQTALNPNSQGALLYKVALIPMDDVNLHWQAGDLVEIQFNDQTSSEHISNTCKRKYSIASIPNDKKIELLVRQRFTETGQLGIGSGALTQHLTINNLVTLELITNRLFHRVECHRPVILIGSGSGLAGLRAHIKERISNNALNNWLIFGERQRQYDNILQNEMDNWLTNGYMARIDRVFSRDNNAEKYVQDCLITHSHTVREWVNSGAAIYVCGSLLGMAKGIDSALKEILGSVQYSHLREQGLYRRDVY